MSIKIISMIKQKYIYFFFLILIVLLQPYFHMTAEKTLIKLFEEYYKIENLKI